MDAEDLPEATLGEDRKTAQLAELRRLANVTENNLAVWQALALHLGGRNAFEAYDRTKVEDGDMVTIPAWCAQYLLQSAINIGELSNHHFLHRQDRKTGVSPEAALEMLPRALGLSGSGWNAFRRAVSTWESLQDWRMFQDAKERGLSSSDAVEEVRRFRNLGSGPRDHRAAARRISDGRKLEEMLTKPHP
jgi:hypothetical protein